jgi:hypothetical protein
VNNLGAGGIVKPARGVAFLRRDILEGDREMDKVQVEVVDTPILELLPADGLHLLVFVEGLPELRDDEEVLTLYESFLDGAGDTLTGFDFVAVVYN